MVRIPPRYNNVQIIEGHTSPRRKIRYSRAGVRLSARWVSPLYLQTDLKEKGGKLSWARREEGGRLHAPSNLILSPISVNAWMKSAVSFDATCPLSRLSIFKPSVQSAQREISGAIASASEPSGVTSEKDRGDDMSGVAPAPPEPSDGGAQFAVAISVMSARSKRSGRSSSPLRTGNLVWLST
jgi:hypothetical protein